MFNQELLNIIVLADNSRDVFFFCSETYKYNNKCRASSFNNLFGRKEVPYREGKLEIEGGNCKDQGSR